MDFVSQFIASIDDLWSKTITHPFVKELESGSLPKESFVFYLKQDYIYLVAYCRTLALACYKSPNLSLMTEMSALLNSTLASEMQTHRDYAADMGIGRHELESAEPAPTTLAYTSYTLEIASRCDFLSNIVCLLPCAIGYAEIGTGIKTRQGNRVDSTAVTHLPHPFQRWIDTYSGDEFVSYAERLKAITNELLSGYPSEYIKEQTGIFRQSTRYELEFWEMAWTRRSWSA